MRKDISTPTADRRIRLTVKDLVTNRMRTEEKNHSLVFPQVLEYVIVEYAMAFPSWYRIRQIPRWDWDLHYDDIFN